MPSIFVISAHYINLCYRNTFLAESLLPATVINSVARSLSPDG